MTSISKSNLTITKKDSSSIDSLFESFSVNNIALVKGRPQLLNLKQLIQLFVAHRHEVLIRKTKFRIVRWFYASITALLLMLANTFFY